MELTSIAYIYLPVATWCFFQRHDKHLLSLLLVSTVLQAASVVNIKVHLQTHGLNPFMFTVGLLALRMLPRLSSHLREISVRPPVGPGLWLSAYLVWAAAITVVMPMVFEGIAVRSPQDAYSGKTAPLNFSLVSSWQVVGLGAVAVMFVFPAVRRISGADLKLGIKQGLVVSFILVALANLYEQLANAMGLSSLVGFWASNPGYNQDGVVDITYPGVTRVGVPFTEPSYASAYLVSFIGGVLMLLGQGQRTWRLYVTVVLVVLVLISSGGSTGLVALGILAAGGALYFASRVAHYLFRGKPNARSLYWFSALLSLAVVAWIFDVPGMLGIKLQSFFYGLVVDKLNVNNSGTLARLNADIHGFQLLKETYGLGVGLGGNRTSSFISSMFASVGVVGAFLFVGFVYHLIRDYAAYYSSLSGLQLFALGAVVMMLLPLCLSIPDLNLPMLWAALWVLYVLRPSARR